MDAFKTHGAFSWSELLTTDPQAAVKFYTQLFGWGTDAMEMGAQAGAAPGQNTYHVVKAGDAAVGGIMAIPPHAGPMPPTWSCYVTVDNVDATLAKCAELGGQTLVPAMDVPNVGRMAVIKDPQGAVLNVMQYN